MSKITKEIIYPKLVYIGQYVFVADHIFVRGRSRCFYSNMAWIMARFHQVWETLAKE